MTRGSSTLGWVVYLGAFPTAIAFTTWAYALSHTTAGRMGATTYLVPPVTIMLAWAAAGRDAGRAGLRGRRPVPRRGRPVPAYGTEVVAVRTPADGASIARLAGLLADPTRAGMCLALIDGRAWTAGELATATGVARSTASEHLDQLVAGGLLAQERQGRHRYLRLASPGRRAAGRVPRRRRPVPAPPRGPCAPSRPARRWRVAAPATTTWPAGSASR